MLLTLRIDTRLATTTQSLAASQNGTHRACLSCERPWRKLRSNRTLWKSGCDPLAWSHTSAATNGATCSSSFSIEGSSLKASFDRYPEVQYCFDMVFPSDGSVVPKPNDTEVESFDCYTVEETVELMRTGNFKPNCGLVLVDFFVRHGLLSGENDPKSVAAYQSLFFRLICFDPATLRSAGGCVERSSCLDRD